MLQLRFQKTGLFPFSQDISQWSWIEFFETQEILTGDYKVTTEELQDGIASLRGRKATWLKD